MILYLLHSHGHTVADCWGMSWHLTHNAAVVPMILYLLHCHGQTVTDCWGMIHCRLLLLVARNWKIVRTVRILPSWNIPLKAPLRIVGTGWRLKGFHSESWEMTGSSESWEMTGSSESWEMTGSRTRTLSATWKYHQGNYAALCLDSAGGCDLC